MQQYNKAIIGTIAAFITTLIVQWLSSQGVELDTQAQAGIAALCAAVVGGLVYTVANKIEQVQ